MKSGGRESRVPQKLTYQLPMKPTKEAASKKKVEDELLTATFVP